MRFTKQRELKEKYFSNEKKLVQKFLWFPLTINCETRWLEEASYVCVVRHDESTFTWKPWQWC
jgi:hypothetical protein|tara:strand:+ start:177 stop:365 length:189 start_codon:yes stop_codon:yes gene_type:complete